MGSDSGQSSCDQQDHGQEQEAIELDITSAKSVDDKPRANIADKRHHLLYNLENE